MGHADQAMTSHYTHIEAQAHLAAAEAVARLVEGARFMITAVYAHFTLIRPAQQDAGWTRRPLRDSSRR